MYSIKENAEHTLIIKKSKFIIKAFKINEFSEIEAILNNHKIMFKDATHICYAYIINNKEKCFDDGEPSGTAGISILNVLKKRNLDNILIIVIRYFGGIKLGANGLIRAYSNSTKEVLNKTSIIQEVFGYLIEINFSLDNIKKIDYILDNRKILEKRFKDIATYKFYLKEEELNFLEQLKSIAIKISIKEKVLIIN